MNVTPQMHHLIASYVERGWIDANREAAIAPMSSSPARPRSAYLVLASKDIRVLPLNSVQVTTRCYQPFRGRHLVVGSDAARRFDLIDLKVGLRSQFLRAENLPLRSCVGEASPELIQWPLEVCGFGSDVVASAMIPESIGEDDLGAEFELILLGEVL